MSSSVPQTSFDTRHSLEALMLDAGEMPFHAVLIGCPCRASDGLLMYCCCISWQFQVAATLVTWEKYQSLNGLLTIISKTSN
jgi:hypothetical protein